MGKEQTTESTVPEEIQAVVSNKWEDFAWPLWVPEKIRGQIESFWGASMGRGPNNWIRSTKEQDCPPFGMWLKTFNLSGDKVFVEGKWIHCWNNIGRVVRDDGAWDYACIPRCSLLCDCCSWRQIKQ